MLHAGVRRWRTAGVQPALSEALLACALLAFAMQALATLVRAKKMAWRHAAVVKAGCSISQHKTDSPVVLLQALATLVRYVRATEEGLAAHGIRLLAKLIDAAAPALDAPGWAAVVDALLALAAEDPLQELAPEAVAGEQIKL